MNTVRKAADRLCVGTSRTTARLGEWLLPGTPQAAARRICGLLAATAFCLLLLVGSPQLMWAVAAAVIAGAWHAGAPAPASEDHGQEQPEETGVGYAELVAALHHVADPHVHLVPLSQHLGLGEDTGPVRELLAQASIPVAKGVRVPGRGVSPGVKADDLPPLPAPTSDTPVGRCSAGQRDNNNSNNPIVERPYPGMVIVRDPTETALRRTTLKRP